ncbi:uncharacterized protein EDB93DRAFT_1090823 [Suillus bovinus]|uniref:uncharacterized protein n=1 Tax=Suillus bovinus TaxID=48563 RepID=UPI001B865320|nr:uncharacterized protein EDB93DRAFT_1090823 [Suillus bovinus]KAG2138038.1 hypothetical protein EDB93DRAFT_1090823 [Suillus bovinus]
MPSENLSKLGENNYYEWRMLIEAVLIRRGLMDYVDGSKTMPLGSPNSKAVKDFLKKQAEAHTEIVLQVETSQLSHVRDCNPTVIWKNLETVHWTCGSATCQKFLTLKKADDISIQAWIAQVCRTAF